MVQLETWTPWLMFTCLISWTYMNNHHHKHTHTHSHTHLQTHAHTHAHEQNAHRQRKKFSFSFSKWKRVALDQMSFQRSFMFEGQHERIQSCNSGCTFNFRPLFPTADVSRPQTSFFPQTIGLVNILWSSLVPGVHLTGNLPCLRRPCKTKSGIKLTVLNLLFF